MDTILLILLIFGSNLVAGLQYVENMPLYTHGIYYEKLEPVRLQFGEWKFHSSLKLDVLPKEIQVVEVFSKYINESCSKLDSDFGIDCEHILREINVELDDMKSIKSIINAQCQRSSRKKDNLISLAIFLKKSLELWTAMIRNDWMMILQKSETMSNN